MWRPGRQRGALGRPAGTRDDDPNYCRNHPEAHTALRRNHCKKCSAWRGACTSSELQMKITAGATTTKAITSALKIFWAFKNMGGSFCLTNARGESSITLPGADVGAEDRRRAPA